MAKKSPSSKSTSTKKSAPEEAKSSDDSPAKADEPLSRKLPAKFPWLTSRSAIAVQVALQIILLLVIFVQLNYLSCRRYSRKDLTETKQFTLSDTSVNYASNLKTDVQIVMAFFSSTPLYGDVKNLLEEYSRHGGDRITTEYLDLSRDRQRLAQLKDKYGVQFTTNTILILAPDRTRVITAEELVNRDRNGRVIEYKGEDVVTSALLDVTENQQKRFYMVVGKRKAEELTPIASQLNAAVSLQNAQIEALSLANTTEIPPDADAILLPGNSADLTERETQMLRDYLGRDEKGGLFIWLDPTSATPNIDSLARENGVSPREDRVLSVQSVSGLSLVGQIVTAVPITFFKDSGVTQNLVGIQTTLQGNTQSLDIAWQDELLKSEGIHARPIAAADGSFWGETEFNAESVAYNPEQDTGEPDYVFIAASVERGDISDPDLKGATSRLVIVANPNVIDPQGRTTKAAVDFTLASLNWLVNRESLTGITPKKPTAWAINISTDQFSRIQGFNIYLLPGLALFVAAAVWYVRRA